LCTLEQYDEAVRDVGLLLQGKTADLESALGERMQRASEELRFEAAARYRDQLKTISRLGEQQKMMMVSGEDIDISVTTARLRNWRCRCSRCAKAKSSASANSSGRTSKSRSIPARSLA